MEIELQHRSRLRSEPSHPGCQLHNRRGTKRSEALIPMIVSKDVTHLLLSNIPRAPKKTDTTTLRSILTAAGIERTPRAVQMKLQELCRDYPLRCIESSKPYQWQWMAEAPDYEYPAMNPHVALTLKMAHEYLSDLLPRATLLSLKSRLQRAEQVLKDSGTTRVSVWQRKVRVFPRGLSLQPPHIEPSVVDVVYDALLDDRRFETDYRRRGQHHVEHYDINPIALVVRGSVLTLICTIGKGNAPRQLHLHRMRSPKLSALSSRVPEGFDVDRHIAEGYLSFSLGAAPMKIELLVAELVAETLEETPLSPDQVKTEASNDRYRIKATVPDTLDLQGWLKSYGSLIEVVRPAKLRKAIAKEARRMADLYAGTASTR